MTTTDEQQAKLNIPQETTCVLTQYRLDTQLAQEELTTSYLAHHLALDRPVHIHILRRTDWVSVSRFQLAVRLAARLNHANVLPVLDAGHDEQLGDYMVTPLLNTQLLSDKLAQHMPLSPVETMRIASHIAAALEYLHAQQIIHRDVQPANIILTPDGIAYLANLSLAACPDTPDLSEIDEADYLTPYAAPEQSMHLHEATTALDIYSLGAVVYHMLSGEMPPSSGVAIPTLATRDATLAEADPVIQRMLMMNPALRYQHIGEAMSALRRALHLHRDNATDDMDEEQWEPTAEWLENPLETRLGNELMSAFVGKSHTRADTLHHAAAIRRLLNRWSRKGMFRKYAVGHVIALEHITSYNIYFYELCTLFETRTPLPPRQYPQKNNERSSALVMLPLWEVSVPYSPPCTAVPLQEVTIPNSIRVFPCPACNGVGRITCKTCNGKGTVTRTRTPRSAPQKSPSPSTPVQSPQETCPSCQGYLKQQCPVCQNSGTIVEEHVFNWSRTRNTWNTHDDLEGLPRLALQQRLETVYEAPINVYESRWNSIGQITELIQHATTEVGNDTRIHETSITIKGVPVTQVDYYLDEEHKETMQTLYIIGFDQEIVGNWTLLNTERLLLIAVSFVLLLVVVGVVLLLLSL